MEKWGVSVYAMIAVYFAMALGAALVIIAFGSWAKNRLRATLLGFLSGALLAVILNFTLAPIVLDRPLRGVELILYMAWIGTFPGAFLAALYWEKPSP